MKNSVHSSSLIPTIETHENNERITSTIVFVLFRVVSSYMYVQVKQFCGPLFLLVPPDKVHFTISGQGPEGATYAVNNNEDVSLICLTESNPNSDIIVKNAKNEILVLLKNTTILRHTLHEVSCGDAGEYECSARNAVTTGHEAKSTLILIVKCKVKQCFSLFVCICLSCWSFSHI
jgi:hypothetical protein